jgi:hypothetical protein
MKRLIQLLLAGLFPAMAVSACTFEPADPASANVEQAHHTACWITQYSHRTAYSKLFTVKAKNAGTAACPFRASIDIYKNGAFLGATPVISLSSLAPFSPGPPPVVRSFVQSFPVSGACEYDLWFAFKPNYPNGDEQWFRMEDGPFPCI